MTATYFYKYPFAISPDTPLSTNPVPTSSATPYMSYQNGYTVNYQEDLLNNVNALPLIRTQMNVLFNDITTNIQQYQIQGTPNWITNAQNLGVAFPYPLYARVLYTDGKIYENQLLNNTAVPGSSPGTDNWLIISGGNEIAVNVVVIGSTGTYTPSANMAYCTAVVSGGGGGGGSCDANSVAGQVSSGGGGASGETRSATFSAATIGAGVSVTIGAGGTGGVAGAGGTGGSTLFGAAITAGGGLGGARGISRSGVNFELGGAGSVTGSGGIATVGTPGGVAFVTGNSLSNSVSGAGASGYYGGGAVGVTGSSNGANAADNNAGGSGGASIINTAKNGGAGGAGLVVITEYIYA